jgi:hypothetical protein
MFKLISKYFKELSILIILLGLVRQFIYYSNFDIPIKYFFNFSELWLIISDKLIIVFPVILILLLGMDMELKFRASVKEITELKESKTSNPEEFKLKVEAEIKRKKEHFKSNLLRRILLLIFAGVAIYYLITSKEYYIKIQVSAILLMILVYYFVFDVFKFSVNVNVSFTFIFGILLFFIIFFSSIEIRNVENGIYRGTTIITDDTTYTSNDTSYFIGKTDNFVFIYNKKDTSSIIIPMEFVKKIILKRRRIIYKSE